MRTLRQQMHLLHLPTEASTSAKEPPHCLLCAQRALNGMSAVSLTSRKSAWRVVRRCFERSRRTVGRRSDGRPVVAASALVEDEDGIRRLV